MTLLPGAVQPRIDVVAGRGPRPTSQVVGVRGGLVRDLLALTKPRIVVMVLLTTIVGYRLGLASPPDWVRLIHLVLGTALAAGGTLALNQYLERGVDALMERTCRRPLPGGRLEPLQALAFGGTATGVGLAYLGLFVNAGAAGVTASTSVLYLLVYTPLKRRTPLCTVVGAVSGALPPLTGWVGAGDGLDVGAGALFGIVLLWQLPHTLAIAWLYRDDYAHGGIRILPAVDREGAWTGRCIVVSSLALLGVSVLPVPLGLAGGAYVVGSIAAGASLVAVATWQALTPSAAGARRVLLASLLYLPVVLGLLAYHKL